MSASTIPAPGRTVLLGGPVIGAEERAAVDRVLRSGMLAQGPEVAAFEAEFAEHFGLDRPCVAVSSGTAGLHLGLLAARIGPGDEVIVPSFTFAATANAVALTGATPVFADIDPDHFCLDPAAVAAAVGPRTAAVMPVHLYGHPAPMNRLRAVADRHGLALFEDAAQAHGGPTGPGGRLDRATAGQCRVPLRASAWRGHPEDGIGGTARLSPVHGSDRRRPGRVRPSPAGRARRHHRPVRTWQPMTST